MFVHAEVVTARYGSITVYLFSDAPFGILPLFTQR
jgi:hypothetical protein